MKYCSDCDDAIFDADRRFWYCQKTPHRLLCERTKWFTGSNLIEDKTILDELECYLEVE